MTSIIITVTEAVRAFADIIGRVYYKGEEFDIKKGNQIVAHLGPGKSRSTLNATELKDFFAACPALSKNDVEDFEKDLKIIRSQSGLAKNEWE